MRIAIGTFAIKLSKMTSRLLISTSAFTLLAALSIPIRLAAQDSGEGRGAKLVIFDAPGAGTDFEQGMF